MSSKKRKAVLSVVVVEDHNEVLHHIYRSIGSKLIPLNNGCMIHFDSHPDMMIPRNLDATRIYEKEHVLNSLSIENWIFPAVYAGHFTTLVWIKPVWATQLKNGTHKFKIGIDKISKEIKVTCPQSYFVSELAWSPEEKLQNVRDVILEVCTMGVPEADEAGVFNYELQMCTLSSEVEKIASEVPYVLDIDLDFYSTRNPFLTLFTEEQFAILRQLYHYEHPKCETEEALQEATVKRQEQLQDLENIFTSLKNNTAVETSSRVEAIRSLLSTFPTDCPPDLTLLHDAGCTCDDCDLPHHVTPRDTVRHLVRATEVFLKKIPKPAMITIARSSRDDYCPPEDVDFIQDLVLEMLKNVYGDIDVKMDYETEEDEEPKEGTSSAEVRKAQREQAIRAAKEKSRAAKAQKKAASAPTKVAKVAQKQKAAKPVQTKAPRVGGKR